MDACRFVFYKNPKRIFLNTSLGCKCDCSYCYLLHLIDNKENIITIRAEKVIEEIASKNILKKGKNGSIISIGCFSECWDEFNKENTKKLIEYFIQLGNPIQIATKKYLDYKELEYIAPLIKWEGQLVIYVSSSTISYWDKYENKTLNPRKRFETFKLSNILNIPSILYIKPVIPNITVKDVDIFKNIIINYNLKDVVVGSMFTEEKNQKKAPIGNNNLYSIEVIDQELLLKELSKVARMHKHSIEVTEMYRKK